MRTGEKQTEIFTLLCNIALASGGQAHHHHANAGVLHLDAAPISLGCHGRESVQVLFSVEDVRAREFRNLRRDRGREQFGQLKKEKKKLNAQSGRPA